MSEPMSGVYEEADHEIEVCVSNIAELWGEPMNGDDVEKVAEKFKKRLAEVMGEVEE